MSDKKKKKNISVTPYIETNIGKDVSNQSDSLNYTIDQVMVKIPFSEPGSEGIKVWVFFIVVVTGGLILGFLISLVNIFSQRRKIMSQRAEIRKLKSELDTLRNQNIDENLILSDNFHDDNESDIVID